MSETPVHLLQCMGVEDQVSHLQKQIQPPFPEGLEFLYTEDSGWVFNHVAVPENDSVMVLRRVFADSFKQLTVRAIEAMARPAWYPDSNGEDFICRRCAKDADGNDPYLCAACEDDLQRKNWESERAYEENLAFNEEHDRRELEERLCEIAEHADILDPAKTPDKGSQYPVETCEAGGAAVERFDKEGAKDGN